MPYVAQVVLCRCVVYKAIAGFVLAHTWTQRVHVLRTRQRSPTKAKLQLGFQSRWMMRARYHMNAVDLEQHAFAPSYSPAPSGAPRNNMTWKSWVFLQWAIDGHCQCLLYYTAMKLLQTLAICYTQILNLQFTIFHWGSSLISTHDSQWEPPRHPCGSLVAETSWPVGASIDGLNQLTGSAVAFHTGWIPQGVNGKKCRLHDSWRLRTIPWEWSMTINVG